MSSRLGHVLCCVTFLVSFQFSLAEGASTPFPAWVTKAITDRQAARSRDSVEESTYNGKRVFLINRGDVADTGDEHVLFSEDGKAICQFGGFVGRVTAGACDMHSIIYVRTLYPTR
jgi:hypothetical protein